LRKRAESEPGIYLMVRTTVSFTGSDERKVSTAKVSVTLNEESSFRLSGLEVVISGFTAGLLTLFTGAGAALRGVSLLVLSCTSWEKEVKKLSSNVMSNRFFTGCKNNG
jgi:hypothetical protein